MKYIVTLFALSLSFLCTVGQGIKFESGEWELILAKAEKENKFIFIDCYTVWCVPCKWMDANIFPLESVGKFYNDNFINVKMDMEKGDGPAIASKYKINSFPTYMILDYRGKVIHREGGSMDKDKFISLGKLALDPSRNLAGLDREYQNGNRERGFLRKYILALGKGKQKERQQNIFENYFRSFSSDLVNRQDFDVIMSVAEPDDESFKFILKNREAYKQVVAEKDFDFKIYSKLILPFGFALSKDGIEALRAEANKYKPLYPRVVQRTEDLALLRWYKRQNMTEELARANLDFVQTYSPSDPSDILYYMKMVVESKDMLPEKYGEVLSYMKDIVQKFPDNYSLADVYAAFLYKANKRQEALIVAKRVVAQAPADKQANLWSVKFLKEAKAITQ